MANPPRNLLGLGQFPPLGTKAQQLNKAKLEVQEAQLELQEAQLELKQVQMRQAGQLPPHKMD